MLPSPDQNLKIGSVGRDFFFFFFFYVPWESWVFQYFFFKFLNGENSGGMQSKRIYKSCKCFFKPLNTNFSKFFAQIWHLKKKKKKKNPTLFFRILRSVGRGQHNNFFFWPKQPSVQCDICKYWHETRSYIVWLSLIWDTDWLNTVTRLTNISVCCPPQSCGGGTLIDTTKCFHSGKIFHANKLQNGLAILSLQTCMLTALTAHWLFIARTGCLLRAQYNNGYALHCGAQYNGYALYCAQLKGNPRWKKILSFVNFYKLCRSRAGQGNGEPYNITDGDFVVGNITECSQYLGVWNDISGRL